MGAINIYRIYKPSIHMAGWWFFQYHHDVQGPNLAIVRACQTLAQALYGEHRMKTQSQGTLAIWIRGFRSESIHMLPLKYNNLARSMID